MIVSVDAYRSMEFLTVIWAYYCLLGFFMYSSSGSMTYFAGILVTLSLVVSWYGLYQFFWGFDSLQRFVESVATNADKSAALGIISGKRVFSTFALPGTLWGFLVVALPVHLFLWKQGDAATAAPGHRWLKIGLAISIASLLGAGLLTRSFGFVVALGLLAGTYIATATGLSRKVLPILIVLLILAISAGVFYITRTEGINTANPAVLRFKSWVSAWNIFAMNPMGTGLNTYGVVYTQYMQPGAGETQQAHNTFLQVISELGYPAIFAAMALVVVLVKSDRTLRLREKPLYLLLALMMWVFHNIIDINMYFPSMGVLGAVLIGVLLSRPQRRFETARPIVGAMACIGLMMVVFSAVILLSSELQHRAQVEYENMKPEEAVATLETARMLNPFNPAIYEESGEILLDLHHKTKKPGYLERSTASFARAIQLSPDKANPRIWYALCLSSADNLDAAIKEIRIARELFPSNTRIHAIIRLMEQRVHGAS
jgi:tetratricopeptide (TPR) repeat protein